MLEVQRLTRYYGGLAAVRDVSYLVAAILFLQFLPWAIRGLLVSGVYWLAPAALTAIALALRLSHPPEPPPLVDPDHENKPLALRLY